MRFKLKKPSHFFFLSLFIVFTIFIAFQYVPPSINLDRVKTSVLIGYPSEFNFRQTPNDCGPFNVAAIVRTLQNKEIDSSLFSDEIGWRLPNGYTLPLGLEGQLKRHDIKVETPNVMFLSDKNKIRFLQEQLSQEKPLIVLGEKEGFEHYISVFGFDSTEGIFYVYDSWYDKNIDHFGLTQDGNSSFPGNRSLSSEELLNFWRGSGMYGFYRWYVIVASVEP